MDPLDNGLGSQVADFKPLSTTTVTDQVTRGGSLSTLPLMRPGHRPAHRLTGGSQRP